MWIFIFMLVIVVVLIFTKATPHKDISYELEAKKAQNKNHSEPTVYKYDFKEIPEGYYYHEMVGMYYRGISPKDFGVYDGYVIPEQNNPYDPFAIAVYRNSDGKHVGYLPAGESDLHRTLLYRGGRADAIFKIEGSSNMCYGTVYIKQIYKVFRDGDLKKPYKSKGVREFTIFAQEGYNGKYKCVLSTDYAKDEYDYSVFMIDDYSNIIGTTDDNTLQLFDYVNNTNNKTAWCNITAETKSGILYVPVNLTDKTIDIKMNEFINSLNTKI